MKIRKKQRKVKSSYEQNLPPSAVLTEDCYGFPIENTSKKRKRHWP